MNPNISYNIYCKEAHTHYFEVEMFLENFQDDSIDLFMPVWTPGSYMVREYSKNVESLMAFSKTDEEITIQKLNKNSWRVKNNQGFIRLFYRVYAFEETVRTCFLDQDHASIIPAALFMFPVKFDLPLSVHFHPQPEWKNISTALEMQNDDPWIRTAANRDILIDSPIEIGNHLSQFFTVAGVEHEFAIYGEGNYDVEKIITDTTKIIKEEVKIFQHHPCFDDINSYKRYVFILQNSQNARGGLEHLNSTSLLYKRLGYAPDGGYTEFISLVSHEYFHLWNVKRLRPAALGPFNYNEENYTTSLWIAEGFTNYYDDLILRRADIISIEKYLEIAAKNINDVENAPGNSVHPVAHASFDAWVKYYRQNENSNNAQVNYYTKGGILAMLLDIKIISKSNAERSLDDVMLEAYNIFYKNENRGYTETEFKQILEKYTDEDPDIFYNDYVYGTAEIDYANAFKSIGILLEDSNTNALEVDFGCIVNDKNTISSIRKNSAAEKGKLNVNDELISINNYRYSPTLLSTLITNKTEGTQFEIMINRGGFLKPAIVELQKSDKKNYSLRLDPNANEQQKKLYKKWLAIRE